MLYGVDVGVVLFMTFYGMFATLCFYAAYSRYKKYSKDKPKFTLIQGEKKEDKHG